MGCLMPSEFDKKDAIETAALQEKVAALDIKIKGSKTLQEVRHYAGLSLMGFISAEANRPKGMNFDSIAEASVEMGVAMVVKLHSKATQVKLAKRLADL